MFRLLVISILTLLCICMISVMGRCDTSFIKTYTVSNDTANSATTYVGVTSIVPGQSQIFGWTVAATQSNAFSPLVTLWDMKSGGAWSVSSMIGESESPANRTLDKVLPYPRTISNQLKVVLGPYSAVNIEYTK